MPYSARSYPSAIEDLPADARSIWASAYNSAYDNWDKDKTKQDREGYAFAVAWAAVKESYHKDKDGNWVKNETMINLCEKTRQEIIDVYNKKLKTKDWEQAYKDEKDPHWATEIIPSPLAVELLQFLHSEGIKTGKILEIGCGNGRDSLFMASYGYDVIGIDVVKEAIERAKQNAKGFPISFSDEQLTFQVGNVEALEFEEESFEAVYSVAALHSTPLAATFKEIYRVLKDKGIASLFLYTSSKMGKTTVSYWLPSEIKKYANDAGFEIEEFREHEDAEPVAIPGIEDPIDQKTHIVICILRKLEKKKSNEATKMQTLRESIKTKMEQIKNEIGKRNAKADEDRLRKIQELVAELLSEVTAENEIKLQGIEKELNEWWGNLSGSYEDKKSKIQDALQKQAKDTFVEALFDDYIICSRYDDLFGQTEYFKINYTINADGTIELTEPVKVEMVTVIKEINEKKKNVLWLNEQGGYSEEEREKLGKAREERSKKYKIGIKEGGNLTKPGQYADVSDDEFSDQVNFRYPIDTEAHARNAKVRFASADNREAGGYTKEEQQIIWERIIRAELKFGIEVSYDENNPLDKALPEELKKKMKGYEKKTETIQIKPHRLDETLRFKVDILNELTDKKGEIVEVKAKIDVVQKAGIVNENNRIYPIEVLKPEINRLNELAKLGGAVMCANHPDNDNNAFSGRDVVAKINEIAISDDGIVSIPSLTFVGTQAGKDYIALAKAGVMLETSQRAMGTSTTRKVSGKPVEFVESLQISGFDLFPYGQVSVKDPANKIVLVETKDKSKKEMIKMELTQEQLDEIIQKQVNESLKEKEAELRKQSEAVQKILDERKLQDERQKNEQAVKARIATSDFKFSRFNEAQQKVILEGLDYSGSIEDVNKRLDEKIKIMDSALVAAKLEARGYGSTGWGYVSVGDTGVGERVGRLNEELNRQLSNTDKKAITESAKMKVKPILDQFDRMYHTELKNEETVAANIFTPTSYARVVIEQILPRITALEVCNIHTMAGLIDTISINKYSADFDADIAAVEVGEGADLIETGILVTPYTLYATAKKMRTKITYEAMLSAKAAGNINAEAANLAAIAEDVRRRVDRKLWGVMAAMSNCYSTVKVTTAEALTQVGTTKAWQAANAGWVEKEYIKKENSTTNLRTAQLTDVGTDATSTLQKVEVIDSSATPKTLVKGYLKADGTVKTSAGADADYYVRYADGQIVIADNPVTAGLTTPYKAKYTYTKNAKIFRVNDTALGSSLSERLTVGRDLTAQVKALVRNRYWATTFCGMSEEFAEKISAAKEFTTAGMIPTGTDAVSAENLAVTWAGVTITQASAISESISSAYPVNQIIIGQKGACIYGTFDPLSFDGPTATEKAQTYYVAKQSSAEDVPVAAQLATLMLAHYRKE